MDGQATVPASLTKYHAVSAGARHTCALHASGNLNQPSLGGSTVRCFGAVPARQDSAEDFSRLNALLFTAMAWIFIPACCFAIA